MSPIIVKREWGEDAGRKSTGEGARSQERQAAARGKKRPRKPIRRATRLIERQWTRELWATTHATRRETKYIKGQRRDSYVLLERTVN